MRSISALAGCLVLASAPAALASPRVDTAGHLIRGPASCGTTRTRAPVPIATPYVAPAGTTRTVFLNKNGGTYNITNSATNSSTNTANTIASGDGRTHSNAVIPAIESSFNWPYIVDCVKQQYRTYNIKITETEPTSGNYIEAVVGGNGASTGWSSNSGILGVASADNFCGVTERGIAFSFSTNHLGIQKANDELCATIAHEVGHLLALEHEVASADTMSYVPFASVNQKSFTSSNSQCGTDAQNTNNCSCSTSGAGQVTNSAMRLSQFVGTRPIETNAPSLSVKSPGNSDRLAPSFEVVADASDDTEVDQVAVLIDGQQVAAGSSPDSPDGSTYTIAVTQIAEGDHTLEVRASDFSGNVTNKQLAITVALGAVGDTCLLNEDCHGNLCAQEADGSKFCTQDCSADQSCPSGFDCLTSGAQQFCVPGGGGCSIGGGDGAMLAMLSLGGMLVLGRRRRRVTPGR